MHKTIFFFFIFTFCLNVCVCKKYNNYTLFRGIPVEEGHLNYFINMSQNSDFNFWREPGLVYKPVEFVVGPEAKPRFLAEAERRGIYLTTILEDVQEHFHIDINDINLIEELSSIGIGCSIDSVSFNNISYADDMVLLSPSISTLRKLLHICEYYAGARGLRAFDKQTVKTYIRRNMNSFDWSNFFRLDDIYKWLSDLALAHPSEISVQSIGKTDEKREIMAVKIVKRGCKMRSKVIIEAGIHAREWIGPAFVTYLINEIIQSQTSENEEFKEIALTYEWYIVPVLNPDGYEYSHTTDRLWRKNRNEHGVDLNRNFDNAFGTVGVSTVKTSDTYCGPSAFSEKESKAMRSLVASKSIDLEYYLAFHSYGQYLIIPYADSKKHLDNFNEVNKICLEAAEKIATKYRTTYTTGTAYDTVGYTTSGVSGCWVKGAYQVPYVVTFELRDSGFYGFALPVHKILPTCRETMDGIISLLTPKTFAYRKLRHAHYNSARPQFILDIIVIVFNAFLFIIVRFD